MPEYKNTMISADFEEHTVQTEDKYNLTLLRIIPQSKKSATTDPDIITDFSKRPAVVLVHGLVSSGSHWCINCPQKDLPYRLTEEGYDCWLANLRGTKLSQKHQKFSQDSTELWDFSWHDMALHDLPSMIDYILKTTGNEKLSYVGHSMGCSVFFAAMALRPEYNAKFDVMVALGPAIYGKHIRNKLARLSVPVGNFLGAVKQIYARQIFPMTLIAYAKKFILPFIAINPDRLGGWVLRTLGAKTGVLGTHQIEKSQMRFIAGETPAPTSMKVYCHGSQCFYSGRFQQYDYGKIENYKRYGEPIPPLYDLTKTTVPVATMYSQGDQLATKKDVNRLAQQLPNLIGNFEIDHPQFTHTDFMFGKDADKLVYSKIMEIFKKYIVI